MKFAKQTNAEFSTWLASNGATSTSIADAERQVLIAQGAVATQSNDDMWMSVLGALGYTGNINDRKAAFYAAGASFGAGGNYILLNDSTALLLNDGTQFLLN
jgi:hypothetical protein